MWAVLSRAGHRLKTMRVIGVEKFPLSLVPTSRVFMFRLKTLAHFDGGWCCNNYHKFLERNARLEVTYLGIVR